DCSANAAPSRGRSHRVTTLVGALLRRTRPLQGGFAKSLTGHQRSLEVTTYLGSLSALTTAVARWSRARYFALSSRYFADNAGIGPRPQRATSLPQTLIDASFARPDHRARMMRPSPTARSIVATRITISAICSVEAAAMTSWLP